MATTKTIKTKVTKTVEVEEDRSALILTEREAQILRVLGGMNRTNARNILEGRGGDDLKKIGVTLEELDDLFSDFWTLLR